jgi:hypothetical protein
MVRYFLQLVLPMAAIPSNLACSIYNKGTRGGMRPFTMPFDNDLL